MSSSTSAPTVNYAWPSAEIAVMGRKARWISSTNESWDGAENRDAVRQEKIEEFRERLANPYVAADRGFVDAVSQRARLARS